MDAGPTAGAGGDLKVAASVSGEVGEYAQPHVTLVGPASRYDRIEAEAVVGDVKHRSVVGPRHTDVDVTGARVGDDIAQGFLRGAVEQRFHLGRESQVVGQIDR